METFPWGSLNMKIYEHAKIYSHGPLTRYLQLQVAHAPGMPGTFSRHWHASRTCLTCMLGSLTSSFLWSPWRGNRHRHSPHMHNPQFYVSGKRSIPPFRVHPLLLRSFQNPDSTSSFSKRMGKAVNQAYGYIGESTRPSKDGYVLTP